VVFIGFVTKAGAPPPAPVCELYSRTIGDALIHPPMGGDFDTIYFKASIPNIVWLLDTSASMRALPCEGNCRLDQCSSYDDCSCPFYNKNGDPFFINLGYSPTANPDPVFPQCKEPSNNPPTAPCYENNKVYRRDPGSPCGGLTFTDVGTVSQACETGGSGYICQNSGGPNDGRTYPSLGECQQNCWQNVGTCTWSSSCPSSKRYRCSLNSTCYKESDCQNSCHSGTQGQCVQAPNPCQYYLENYGYYYDGTYYYFKGSALNLYPPKFIAARRAIYELLNYEETRRIRMNLYRFDETRASYAYGARKIGWDGLNPPCNMLDNQSQFDNNRNAIQNAIVNNLHAGDFNSNTPLAEALFNIGNLYACKNNWSSLLGSSAVKDNNNFDTDCSQNQDPFCEDFPCIKSFVVIVTDGLPTEDCNNFIPYYTPAGSPLGANKDVMNADPVRDTTFDDGYSASTEASKMMCLDDIAYFLANNDLRPDREGVQNVVTYTIGFGVPEGKPLLEATARNGNGLFIEANNYDELTKAIKDVLLDILRRTSAFTTAVVPKIRTSSAGGVIVGRFKPSKMPIWEGHLYKFALYSEEIADTDLNNDGDKEDTFLVDAENDIIEENDQGDYVKKGTNIPAVPYWDGGQKMLEKPIDQRKIYTAIDTNGDGRIDRNDGTIEFNDYNVELLAPYLVPDYPANCSDIGTRSNRTITNPVECADVIISFIRGWDVFDYDSDGNRDEPRPWLLGDIMHSNPVEVGPPVLPRPCSSYGAQYAYPQCIMSLFYMKDGSGMAPLEFYPDEYDTLSDEEKNLLALHGGGYHAYNKFVLTYFKRKRIVLVGANDGMLHAFHSGTYQSCDVNTAICQYDEGTGEELWAFIPPDLLPKLKKALFDHHLFVDATPMVRDVWVDLNENYKKEWNEYRTVAIIGEREGGVHFSALDITDVENPQFLWIFPQPDDPAGNWMGQTWSDHLPNPPSIGPVKIEDPSQPLRWKERYVVALNGGFDDMDMRGRGVFIVDAYTGEKIWDYHFDPNATDSRRYMRFSFPASPGFASHSWFFGEQDSNTQKLPLFDLMFAGDAGGQIWTFNLREPGPSNWFGYRVFEEAKESTLLKDKNPFFVIPALSPLHPYVWAVMMGTGDRKGMYKCTGSDCTTYNLRPCRREGCSVSMNTYERTSDNFTASQNVSNTSQITADSWSLSEGSWDYCGPISDYVNVDISSCVNPGLTPAKNAALTCSVNGDYISCQESSTETAEIPINRPLTQKLPAFYSVRVPADWIWDMGNHDSSRFTDSDLLNANNNETSSDKYRKGWRYEHQQDEIVGTSASIPMLKLEDVLKEGCVTWSTFKPNCGASSNPCSTAGAGEGWFYQANFFTGSEESKCKEVFAERGATRAILIGSAPPLPPVQSPTYSGGQLKFYTIITAPGTTTSLIEIGFGSSGVGGSLIYLMDVSRALHENMCRVRTLGYPLATHPAEACE
jgi:type IV pilus assembly protein PilY1